MNADHNDIEFPKRGARRIRGASYDLSPENLKAILEFPAAIYACYALEVCPRTGRNHAQFYLSCKNHVRLATLRQHIKDAHFSKCDASHKDNILYVLKQRDEDYDAHADDDAYDGNAATFKERGERPDERQAAARTLESLNISHEFFDVHANDIPQEIAVQWSRQLEAITDSLCDMIEVFDIESESDDDIEMTDCRPSKKRKF